jgi:hypothetical protein
MSCQNSGTGIESSDGSFGTSLVEKITILTGNIFANGTGDEAGIAMGHGKFDGS